MKNLKTKRKNAGFTIVEMLIALAIIAILSKGIQIVIEISQQENASTRLANYATSITSAIQKRSLHDGYEYLKWDTNGGNAASNAALSWDEANINTFLFKFLVARKNTQCGVLSDGWNPTNDGGEIDTGPETVMEKAALVPCDISTQARAYNIKSGAVLTPDTMGSLGEFHLYINVVDFKINGNQDGPAMNVFNSTIQKIRDIAKSQFDGTYAVKFVEVNDLDDVSDDNVLTSDQCSTAIASGNDCHLDVSINFAGVTTGIVKRIDNENFFVDDVTIGKSISDGRQQCAVWQNNAGTWTATLTDCGLKGGRNDDQVSLIVDNASAQNFTLTTRDASGIAVTHLCNQYASQDAPNGNYRLIAHPTTPKSPCGLTRNGDVVQLLSENAFVDTIYNEKLVGQEIYASMTELYSTTDGQVMLKIYNSTHSAINFSVDNRGNIFASGDVSVNGDITGNKNLTIGQNASFLLQNNGAVRFGDAAGVASLQLNRDASGAFNITSKGNSLNIKNEDGSGVSINKDGTGSTINLEASQGVIAKNGTNIHASKSLLTGKLYSSTGVSTPQEKALSQVIGADMAQYLNDKNSSISIVGTVKVEGEYTRVRKPNCLSFLDDSRYSSPAANPYKDFMARTGITSADGKNYARLILISMYHKTYNSAFGDNQLFSQHAIHSSVDDWDVFMYLSGEGAFSTGAREDGAGGSIGMMLCDLSTLDISQMQL